MKKIILLIFCCAFIFIISFAQTEITVVHIQTGSMASAVATALDGKPASAITKLTIKGNAFLSCADCRTLATTFTTATLETLDLSEAGFENDSTPKHASTGAFDSMQMETVLLPANLRILGDRTFRKCSKLKTINLPSTLKEIGFGAFAMCTQLSLGDLPGDIEKIGAYAFQNASNVALSLLPEGLKGDIGNFTFSGTAVTISEIPEGITEIKNSAFSKTAVTNMIFPAGLLVIGTKAFENCRLSNLMFRGGVPPTVTISAGNHSFSGVTLGDITVCVPEGRKSFFSDEPWTQMKGIKECGGSITGLPQIAEGYKVADWKGFRTSAVTYTFDDNTTKQFTVAQPLFDKYDYKITYFVITNRLSEANWTNCIKASEKGHEVASHTLNHKKLNDFDVEVQEEELRDSQAMIRSKVKTAGCLTLAYPNCALSDRATTEKYYIGARSCASAIVPKTPADFYRINSISTGNYSETHVQTPKQFNEKVNSARDSKGWCVFLIHCIDDEKAHSPTQSDSIARHLEYVNENDADFWVGSFIQVIKYIKERNAVSVHERVDGEESFLITVTDDLPDDIFNEPVTISREMPEGWENAYLTQAGKAAEVKITEKPGRKLIIFDAVPDAGDLKLSKTDLSATQDFYENPICISPNPFRDKIDISLAGSFKYSIFSMDGQLLEKGSGCDSASAGITLPAGTFLLQMYSGNHTYEHMIIKK